MFYSQKELNKIKFKHLGKNVLISDKAAIYNCEKISIGDNVRIDDFCIISAGVGGINFENNISSGATPFKNSSNFCEAIKNLAFLMLFEKKYVKFCSNLF